MPETSEVLQYGDQRIIVVDDEFHVRNTIAPLLEKRGYRVTTFGTAGDMLASYRRGDGDLVLTDVKMPGMDGVTLLDRIRGLDPDVPVILMTAYADLDMTINALRMGAYDFIIKPFDSEYLLSAVGKGLKFRYLCKFEREHKARLEEAVAAKTKELQELHAQFVLSEKMAAIGLLSAGIAHEINNPVAFIASNLVSMCKYVSRMTDFVAWQAGLIASCCSPDLLAEHERYKRANKIDYVAREMGVMAEESLDGVERIKKIVRSLKSFSRKDENVLVEANLNELVESTLTLVWNEIKYVATLNRELGDIPSIKCYPSQLNQVIVNLLINAAQALNQQGQITIRTLHDGGSVLLSIADTGQGIPPEHLDRIFEPMFTTKEPGKGTGLGLSIVNDIVRKHNGEITVDSEPGRGTTFTVRLPVTA